MGGFGAVILLPLGGFAYSQIGYISRSSAEISSNSMPSIYLMGQVQKNAEQVMRLILQHILSSDKQEMARLDQLIQENRTKNARDAYERMLELTAGLNERIRDAIGAFDAPEEFLEVLVGAGKALHDISAEAGSVDSEAVDQIASTYTMDSEHVVHKALFEAAPETEEAPATLEDNVEFF